MYETKNEMPDEVLEDYIRSLQPEINENEMADFVSYFLSKEVNFTKSEILKTDDVDNSKKGINAEQHDLLLNIFRESVFQFLQKKYDEEQLKKKNNNFIEVGIDDVSTQHHLSVLENKLMHIEDSHQELKNKIEENKHFNVEKTSYRNKKYFFIVFSILSIAALLIFLFSKNYFWNNKNSEKLNLLTPTEKPNENKTLEVNKINTLEKKESDIINIEKPKTNTENTSIVEKKIKKRNSLIIKKEPAKNAEIKKNPTTNQQVYFAED